MQKGHLFPIFRGPCRPSGRCTVGGATGANEVPFFRVPCRSRGKCLLSGTPSEPFQCVELAFSAAHASAYPAARWAVDRLLVFSSLQKTYKNKGIRENRVRHIRQTKSFFKTTILWFFSFIPSEEITWSRKTTEISSQKHRTIMGSIFISSMFLFSPLMCN